MSEKIEPGLPDHGFDGLKDALSAYSKEYRTGQATLEPSADADAAILAASRRAINAGPLPGHSAAALALAQRRARATAWKVPLSLAAMLILCATIGVAVWNEKRDAFTPGALSEPTPAAPQTSGAITSAAPLAPAKPSAPALALAQVAPDRQNFRAHSAASADAAGNSNSIVTGSSFRDAPVVVQTHQDFAAPAAATPDASAYQSTSTAQPAARASAKTAPAPQRFLNAPMANMAPIVPSAPIAPAAPIAPIAPAPAAPLPPPAQAAPIMVVPVLPPASAAAPRATLVNPLAIVTEVPLAGSPEQLLIAALSAAVDRGDTQATREILESLHQQYPQATLTPTFAARVAALGLDPAH